MGRLLIPPRQTTTTTELCTPGGCHLVRFWRAGRRGLVTGAGLARLVAALAVIGDGLVAAGVGR